MIDWSRLTLQRWVVWQVVGLALIVAAWMAGLVHHYVIEDPSRLSWFVAGVFGFGVLATGRAAWTISRLLDETDKDSFIKPNAAAKRERIADMALDKITYYAVTATTIGLLGTVIGMSGAMGVLRTVLGGDVASAIAGLGDGSSAALYPTIVGVAGGLWLAHMEFSLNKARANLDLAILEKRIP